MAVPFPIYDELFLDIPNFMTCWVWILDGSYAASHHIQWSSVLSGSSGTPGAVFYFSFKIFLAVPCGLWDLSSPT